MSISVLLNFAIIQVLSFLNNPNDLDPSYKMDLDFWDCFGRKKNLHLIAEEIQNWFGFMMLAYQPFFSFFFLQSKRELMLYPQHHKSEYA